MIYKVLLMPRASKDIDALSPPERDRILDKLVLLRNDLAGDVKRLTNNSPEYRLRVGDYRVLFDVCKTDVIVQRVLHRSKAYK